MSFSSAVSRREFVKLATAMGVASAALPAFGAKFPTKVGGLEIGVQTFSLRNVRYPEVVSALAQVRIGQCELYSGQYEPVAAEQPDITKWRATVPLDFYKEIRKKFNQAGIQIASYSVRLGGGGRGRGGPGGPGAAPGGPGGGPNAPAGAATGAGRAAAGGPAATPAVPAPAAQNMTDEQIDRLFEAAKALGANAFSTGLAVDAAKRFAPFAEKHKIILAVSSTDPDTLTQLTTVSPWVRLDLDIGDFTRAGHDSLEFVKNNYEHFYDIHLKDCMFKGASVPFGTGDSHMKEVLQFLRDKKSRAIANIDCDYPGTGSSVDELNKCYDYVKSCLA